MIFWGHALPQELNDWIAPFVPKAGAEGEVQQQASKEGVLADMKRFFAAEASDERVQAAVAKKAKASSQAPRMPNAELVERLDNGFRKGLGWGLPHFAPKHRLRCHQTGERRYVVEVEGKDGARSLRSCIVADDGARRFESPQVKVGGVRHHPVVHMCCDMGSRLGFQAPAGWSTRSLSGPPWFSICSTGELVIGMGRWQRRSSDCYLWRRSSC